jgi:hypothetical protein
MITTTAQHCFSKLDQNSLFIIAKINIKGNLLNTFTDIASDDVVSDMPLGKATGMIVVPTPDRRVRDDCNLGG